MMERCEKMIVFLSFEDGLLFTCSRGSFSQLCLLFMSLPHKSTYSCRAAVEVGDLAFTPG